MTERKITSTVLRGDLLGQDKANFVVISTTPWHGRMISKTLQNSFISFCRTLDEEKKRAEKRKSRLRVDLTTSSAIYDGDNGATLFP